MIRPLPPVASDNLAGSQFESGREGEGWHCLCDWRTTGPESWRLS